MPDLPSIKTGGVSVKTDGQGLVVQTHGPPAVTVLNVDTLSRRLDVIGSITGTTLHGKRILTTQVITGTGSPAISLDHDLTIFNNSGTITPTIATGVNGQVKYISCSTDFDVTITRLGGGNLFGPGDTQLFFTNLGTCVTMVYNTALGFWVIVSYSNIAPDQNF